MKSSQHVLRDDLPDVAARATAWAISAAAGESGRTSDAVSAAESGYPIPVRGFFVISDAHVGALLLAGLIVEAQDAAEILACGRPISQVRKWIPFSPPSAAGPPSVDAAEMAAVSDDFERMGDLIAAIDAAAYAAIAYGSQMLRGSAQLVDDRGAVEPDVFSADQSVAELKDMQDAEADAASVPGHSQHRTDDGAGHHLFKDHRAVGDVSMPNVLVFGAEVRGEVGVEVARAVDALSWAVGKSDDIVLDVVGVHSHCAFDIAELFCA
jgi:hypothetical protein